jgi:hypothetical protein
MGFTIFYTFEGNERALECHDDNLCSHDAVYYALIHSGAGMGATGREWQGSYHSMVEAAERSGVSQIRWHRSAAQ